MSDAHQQQASGISLRQSKREQRRALSALTQQQHSQALQQLTCRQKEYKTGKLIAAYLANDGEIDPAEIIEHAWYRNKQVFLPVLSPLGNRLYFAPYTPDSKLQLNRFNIPEPVCHPSQWKHAAQLDLILLPLVAFDPAGNRIGMGGVFYDRTLAYLKHRRYWRKPRLAGLAHEIQKTAHIQTQHWDIPMDLILTEKQRYHST